MKGNLLIFSLFLMAITPVTVSLADEYPPSHMCFMPEPPLFLASRRHKERYYEDVNRYRLCMNEFIQDQQEAIRMHEAAIKHARTELKKYQKK